MRNDTRKQKLEEVVLDLGVADSLASARALIMAGEIVVADQRIDKPGTLVDPSARVRRKSRETDFVGRGGEKLAGAISDLGLGTRFKDKHVLDIGASTGGFTQVALNLGAAKVYAVDVGTNQLDWRLRSDERVVVCEKTDIRKLDLPPDTLFDVVLGDLSFVKLSDIVPFIIPLMGEKSQGPLLVKPQFELERRLVPEGGVVADRELQLVAVALVKSALADKGAKDIRVAKSRVKGREGNQEYFLAFCAPERA